EHWNALFEFTGWVGTAARDWDVGHWIAGKVRDVVLPVAQCGIAYLAGLGKDLARLAHRRSKAGAGCKGLIEQNPFWEGNDVGCRWPLGLGLLKRAPFRFITFFSPDLAQACDRLVGESSFERKPPLFFLFFRCGGKFLWPIDDGVILGDAQPPRDRGQAVRDYCRRVIVQEHDDVGIAQEGAMLWPPLICVAVATSCAPP